MTIIGTPASFAIRYAVNPTDGFSRWMNGRFCYIIENFEVGDYNEGTSLGSVQLQCKTILENKGLRWDSELWEWTSEQVFSFLYHKLFKDDDRSDEEVVSDERRYLKHLAIPNAGEVFYNCMAFIIDGTEYSRFIYKIDSDEDSTVLEAHLSVGEFDQTILKFISELNDLR